MEHTGTRRNNKRGVRSGPAYLTRDEHVHFARAIRMSARHLGLTLYPSASVKCGGKAIGAPRKSVLEWSDYCGDGRSERMLRYCLAAQPGRRLLVTHAETLYRALLLAARMLGASAESLIPIHVAWSEHVKPRLKKTEYLHSIGASRFTGALVAWMGPPPLRRPISYSCAARRTED